MSQNITKIAQNIQDRIRELAYLMWETAGRQQSMAMEYWLAAEREVMSTLETGTKTIMSPGEAKPQPKAVPAKPEPKAEPKPTATTEPKAAPKAATPKAAPKAAAPKAEPKPAAKPAAKPEPKAAPTAAAPKAASTPAAKPEPKAAPKGKTGYGVAEIDGIGPTYAEKLAARGIQTTGNLLDRCGAATGRQTVSEATGISQKLLLRWANMADLMRISGIGGEAAVLLEASGVDTVKELRTRNADNLAATMKEVNATKKLARRAASAKQVAKWIEDAKGLGPLITH